MQVSMNPRRRAAPASRRAALGAMLAAALASGAAQAHVSYVDLTGKTAGVTVTNFTNYGWANGTRVAGVGGASTNLGDTHWLQVGTAVSGSSYAAIFKFTARATSVTITATESTTSATNYADPAIALYRGYNAAIPTLPEAAHDQAAADPIAPNATLVNPPETGSAWPFDGRRIAGNTNYDGQFSAFGDFSMASDAPNSRVGLVWLASKSKRAFADGIAAHARGGNGLQGKTETLSYSGLTVGQVYTVIVGGERCIAKSKQPYAAVGGGTCLAGSWTPNTRYSINVKVSP